MLIEWKERHGGKNAEEKETGEQEGRERVMGGRGKKERWKGTKGKEVKKKAGEARKKGSKKASRKGGGNTGTKEGKEKVWEGKGGLERKAGRKLVTKHVLWLQESKGYDFESETDTECIAKLVKYMYDNRDSDDVSFTTLVERVIQQLVMPGAGGRVGTQGQTHASLGQTWGCCAGNCCLGQC